METQTSLLQTNRPNIEAMCSSLSLPLKQVEQTLTTTATTIDLHFRRGCSVPQGLSTFDTKNQCFKQITKESAMTLNKLELPEHQDTDCSIPADAPPHDSPVKNLSLCQRFWGLAMRIAHETKMEFVVIRIAICRAGDYIVTDCFATQTKIHSAIFAEKARLNKINKWQGLVINSTTINPDISDIAFDGKVGAIILETQTKETCDGFEHLTMLIGDESMQSELRMHLPRILK